MLPTPFVFVLWKIVSDTHHFDFTHCVKKLLNPKKKKSNRAEVYRPDAIRFRFGAIRFRFSAIRFRPGAIRFRFGAIRFRPGAIRFRLCTIRFDFCTIKNGNDFARLRKQ